MVDDVPVALGVIDEGAVTLGPPGLVGRVGVDHRVVGAVLPRAQGGLAAGDHHHVAGRRAGGAAFGAHEVVPVAALEEFRRLEPHALGFPFGGVLPAVIDLLRASGGGQAVGGQGRDPAVVGVEIALPVLGHHVARVDAAHVQLDRGAPGAFRPVGRDDVILAAAGRVVDVELAVHLAEFRGVDGVVSVLDRAGNGFPVQQVGGMPDQQGGEVGEGGVGDVEVVAVAQDGRVRIIARENAGFDWRGLGRAGAEHGGRQQQVEST